MRRLTLPLALLLALPLVLPMEAARADVALKAGVSAKAVLDQIESTVRKEFYDKDGVAAFDAAEGQLRRLLPEVGLEAAGGAWLDTLGVSHTGRFTPDTVDYYELSDVFAGGLRERLRELFPPRGRVTYEGVGMAVRTIGGRTFVADLYDGAPAAEAGLEVGDEIVSVEGKPFHEIDSFRGHAGETLEVDVRRRAGAAPISVPVKVERLQPGETFNEAIRRSVRIVERDGRRIGYMRIWSFASRGVEDVIAELLTSEPLRDADGLVLDMRGRWGGAPPDAAEMFIGSSATMTVTDRGGETSIETTSWRKPVVGIIDEGSRSGMEILAYTLKQEGVPLVGAATAGDVLAGRMFPLADNSLLELAVLDVHVDGRRLEGNPVTPTVPVTFELRYAAGADPQLDRAVAEMERLLAAGGDEG